MRNTHTVAHDVLASPSENAPSTINLHHPQPTHSQPQLHQQKAFDGFSSTLHA
jgi:hypothetical protein